MQMTCECTLRILEKSEIFTEIYCFHERLSVIQCLGTIFNLQRLFRGQACASTSITMRGRTENTLQQTVLTINTVILATSALPWGGDRSYLIYALRIRATHPLSAASRSRSLHISTNRITDNKHPPLTFWNVVSCNL